MCKDALRGSTSAPDFSWSGLPTVQRSRFLCAEVGVTGSNTELFADIVVSTVRLTGLPRHIQALGVSLDAVVEHSIAAPFTTTFADVRQ